MTDYARFSTLSTPAGVTYSTDRFTANFDGNSVYNCWSATNVASGKYVFVVQINAQIYAGLSDSATLANSGTPTNGCTLRENGNWETWSAGTENYITTISGVTIGTYAMFAFDMGAKVAWVSIDGTNWYGSSGTALTISQVEAGTDGASISGVSAANVWCRLYFGTGTAVLNSGASAYPWSAPTGFSNLPQTLDILSVEGFESEIASIVWSDTSCGTLQYSVDGGSFVNADGTVSGSGGTATTAGTFTGINSHKIVLTDGANANDRTGSLTFWTPPDPGSDYVFVNHRGTIPDPITGSANQDGTFTPTDFVQFTWLINSVDTTLGAGFDISSNIGIYFDTGFTEAPFGLNCVGNVSGSVNTVTGTFGVTPPGITGPTEFTSTGPWGAEGDTTTSIVTGTIQVTSVDGSGNIHGNISVTHPGGTWSGTDVLLDSSTSATSTNCLQGWSVNNESGFLDYGMAIYGSAPTESLSITAASYSAGTLSFGGLCENSTLSTLSISTDNGATFNPVTALGVSGSTYAATYNTTLTPATYPLVAQDDSTDVQSDPYDLVISPPPVETLTLTGVNYSSAVLSVTGAVYSSGLAALDISTDNGATFQPASFLSPVTISSPSGEPYFALLNGTLLPATYDVVTRDHVTGVLSNAEPLTVSGATESLTLTALGGVLGSLLTFSGVANNGPPSALDISVNSLWTAASGAVIGTGTVNASLTGSNSSTLAVGSYTVQIRDHNTPSVVSNPLSLTIMSSGDIPSLTEYLALSETTLFAMTSGNTTLYGFSGTPFILTPVMSGAVGIYSGSSWSVKPLGVGHVPCALTYDPSGSLQIATIQNTWWTLASGGGLVSGIVPQVSGQPQNVPIGVAALIAVNAQLYAAASLSGVLIELE